MYRSTSRPRGALHLDLSALWPRTFLSLLHFTRLSPRLGLRRRHPARPSTALRQISALLGSIPPLETPSPALRECDSSFTHSYMTPTSLACHTAIIAPRQPSTSFERYRGSAPPQPDSSAKKLVAMTTESRIVRSSRSIYDGMRPTASRGKLTFAESRRGVGYL